MMPTWQWAVYEIGVVLNAPGQAFTYNSVSNPMDTVIVTDNNGDRDDTIQISAPETFNFNAGETPTDQIIQNDALGYSTTGYSLEVVRIIELSGSNGTTVNLYLTRTEGGPPWTSATGIYSSDTLLAEGVTYTVVSFGGTNDTPYVTFVCFTTGTLINTPEGERAIETLSVGDMVLTMDHGAQPIRWIGSRSLDASDLAYQSKLHPVRIKAGVLGDGLPERDLMVSPQHRVLVRSKIAMRMFNTHEVLIPAVKLLPLEGVDIAEEVESVTYWHMLFDTHEVVFSDGAATESLYTGPQALKALSPASRSEITALFPEITEPGYVPPHARPAPEKGKFMKELIARHVKNSKPLYVRG